MRLFHRYDVLQTIQEDVHVVRDLLAPAAAGVAVLKQIRLRSGGPVADPAHEFRTLTGLRHPGIVPVLDFGGDGSGARYVVTERVDGEPLDHVLPRAGADVAVALFEQAVDALAWAHRHGVLHGDLKPQNVVARLEPAPRLVLIDFGLARSLAGDARPIGGTPGFVAPELLEGSRATVASDLWGLGAAFFAAFAGGPPAGDPAARLAARGRIPARLAPLIDALLARDPAARPVDALAVLRRLGTTPGAAARAEPPFVGRAAELARLGRGGAAVTLLRGPEGFGKSRLLREARWRLQLEGRLVAETRHAPADPRALGPVPDAARMLAAVAGAPPAPAAAAAAAAALDALRAAAGLRPALLVDDVDLARPAAVDLLLRVAREVAAEPCVPLVLACAPGAVADRLAADVPGLEVVDLGPLPTSAVASLVAAVLGRPDESLAGALHDRTGGLPFLAVDLLRDVGPRTEPGEIDPGHLRLSGAAAEIVRRGLGRVLPDDRAVLRTLAALERPIPPADLAALAGGDCAVATSRLERAGLVAVRDGRVRLAAPAGAAALLSPDARSFHARLAERLAARGGDPADVDRQRAASGDVDAALRAAAAAEKDGPRAALDVLEPLAAEIRAAATTRPGQALAWARFAARAGEHAAVRETLERLAGHEDAAVRAEALVDLGEALERLGDLSAARARLEAALPLVDRPADRAAALLRLARVAGLSGDHAAAAEHARTGLAAGGGPAGPLRVQLGIALVRAGSPEQAAAELEAARAEAEAAGDRRTAAAALGNLAILQSSRGRAAEARDLFARALAEAEAAGDTTALPVHLLNLSTAYQALQDPGAAVDLLRRAEGLARRLGRTGPLGAALINLANLYAEIGAATEARTAAREAAEVAERSGVRAIAAQASLVLAEVAAGVDPPAAKAHAATAREAFAAIDDPARAAEARLVEGELALAAGDFAAARAAAGEARAGVGPAILPRVDLLEGNLLRAQGAGGAALDLLERALAGAERAGAADGAARAECAIADLLDEVGSPLGGARRGRAAERLTAVALRLPAALREAFWRVPWRAAAREAGDARRAEGGRGAGDAAFRLLDLARRILAERDAQRVLELALDAGLDVVGGERGFLLLREGGGWKVAAARNIDHESIRRPSFKFSRSVAEQVATTGEPVLTASAVDDPRFAAARSVHQLALQSIVCVPIRSPESVLGTIYIENRFSRGRFGEEHLRLAAALADQVALALEAGRLERELRERAEQLDAARAELARRVEAQEDELARLEREVRRSRAETALRHEYAGIVGRGTAMRRLLETIDRAAETSLPVLIEGATGTGKELVARALHVNGPRRDRPFVSVNCGALPDLLLESELFGHARGAFTGADRARLGLMREASGGTLFLDEIGEMSAAMQVKLLRAIQSAEVTPLGTERPVPIDVRIVAATNRRLAERVAEGRFREDLFYRLNVIRVVVPTLAERREDVPELCAHFLRRAAEASGAPPKRLSRAALALLLRHGFPGNVRELENLLSSAAVFAPGEEIRPEDLQPLAAGPAPPVAGGSRRDYLRAADRHLVQQALEACGFNLSAAARRLGVSRPTLYRRLAACGVSRRPEPGAARGR